MSRDEMESYGHCHSDIVLYTTIYLGQTARFYYISLLGLYKRYSERQLVYYPIYIM